MRGGITRQVQVLYEESGVNLIGKKRHEIKQIARKLGAKTSVQIAAITPISSYDTADKYRDVWIAVCKNAKEQHKRFDIEELVAADIEDYLSEEVIEAGLAYRTFKTYAAACGKLETALRMYAARFQTGKIYNFRAAIDALRQKASDDLHYDHETREYDDPLALISRIHDESFGLAASIQNEGGARITETGVIRGGQLVGTRHDKIAGTDVGIIHLPSTVTKGGRVRDIRVSVPTFNKLSGVIAVRGEFRIDHQAYRKVLQNAARASGQTYNGSHGLRYNFAQRRYLEYLRHEYGEIRAKLKVAQEMGHSRPIITEWYLKKQQD